MRRMKPDIVRSWTLGGWILSCLAASALPAPHASAAGTAVLQCTIIDAESGEPLPVRCRVVDCYGSNRYPPPGLSLYHTALGGYFYANGSFSVTVPTGAVVVRAGHGFEYGEAARTVSVSSDTSIVLALDRFVDMNGIGWYGGDSHTHINHAGGYYILDPEDAYRMGRAEDLSVVNCLDNAYYFLGTPDPAGGGDCVVFMTEELRTLAYGHVGLLGVSSLIEPYSPAWWPLLSDVADSVHRYPGAIVVSSHPVPTYDFNQIDAWPGTGLARALPVDCVSGKIDAMDVMSYSNCATGGAELDLWYRLMNCGFRVPASAGTDAALNRLDSGPAGGFRAYVRLQDGTFSYGAWLAGLKAGRSFVTNGPLITGFEIEGSSPGDSRGFAHPGARVSGTISVECASPIDLVEIVVNGVPVITYLLQPARSAFDTSFTLVLDESSWIAAAVYGVKRTWMPVGSYLFAHTSAVYCTVADEPVCSREDASFFAGWIEDLEALTRANGEWADAAQSARVFGEFSDAREYYQALASGGVAGTDVWLDRSVAAPRALRCENTPNPFGSATSIDFAVPAVSGAAPPGGRPGDPAARVTLAVYDVSGRIVRRLVDDARAAGEYRIEWDGRDEGGRSAASGVYFARLFAGGISVSRKMLILR